MLRKLELQKSPYSLFSVTSKQKSRTWLLWRLLLSPLSSFLPAARSFWDLHQLHLCLSCHFVYCHRSCRRFLPADPCRFPGQWWWSDASGSWTSAPGQSLWEAWYHCWWVQSSPVGRLQCMIDGPLFHPPEKESYNRSDGEVILYIYRVELGLCDRVSTHLAAHIRFHNECHKDIILGECVNCNVASDDYACGLNFWSVSLVYV